MLRIAFHIYIICTQEEEESILSNSMFLFFFAISCALPWGVLVFPSVASPGALNGMEQQLEMQWKRDQTIVNKKEQIRDSNNVPKRRRSLPPATNKLHSSRRFTYRISATPPHTPFVGLSGCLHYDWILSFRRLIRNLLLQIQSNQRRKKETAMKKYWIRLQSRWYAFD